MDANERRVVLDRLTSSRAMLLDAIAGLTPEQWSYQSSEGRWSIADCVEHVVLVENRIVGAIGKMVTRAPEPEKGALVAHKDAQVLDRIPDRSRPVQAPEPARPRGSWPVNQLAAEFERARARTIQFASETEDDLRSHVFAHVTLGDLDCYQWLLLLGPHSERHAKQIREVKAEAGFPPPR